MPIFDRERALLDAFHHFHIFGSLSVALEIFESHLADIVVQRLVEYAVHLDVAAVAKRLGWALEELGVLPDVLAPLRSYPAKRDSSLDPGRPAAATIGPGTSSRTCTMADSKTSRCGRFGCGWRQRPAPWTSRSPSWRRATP